MSVVVVRGGSAEDDSVGSTTLSRDDVMSVSRLGTPLFRASATECCNKVAADFAVVADRVTAALDATEAANVVALLPASSIRSISLSPLKSGMKRVHQNATRKPRSRIRCFRMKRTTRKKKRRAEKIRMRSSQSDFSRAVISCLDVPIRFVSVS